MYATCIGTVATDQDPTEMFQSVIKLKVESEWRTSLTIDLSVAETDKAQNL